MRIAMGNAARNRSRILTFPQVREGQAQIFGVCPQSEVIQFAAERLSQTLARGPADLLNGESASDADNLMRVRAITMACTFTMN